MDNWTLLSAGFDVGEEADGGSRTTATPREGRDRGRVGQVGEKKEKKMCTYARGKRKEGM